MAQAATDPSAPSTSGEGSGTAAIPLVRVPSRRTASRNRSSLVIVMVRVFRPGLKNPLFPVTLKGVSAPQAPDPSVAIWCPFRARVPASSIAQDPVMLDVDGLNPVRSNDRENE
jgi:hypothetical protein